MGFPRASHCLRSEITWTYLTFVYFCTAACCRMLQDVGTSNDMLECAGKILWSYRDRRLQNKTPQPSPACAHRDDIPETDTGQRHHYLTHDQPKITAMGQVRLRWQPMVKVINGQMVGLRGIDIVRYAIISYSMNHT